MKNLLLILISLTYFQNLGHTQIQVDDPTGNNVILHGASMFFNSADNLRHFTIFSNTLASNPDFSINYQNFVSNGVVTYNIINIDGDDFRVGIGTANPSTLLHVNEGDRPQMLVGEPGGSLGYFTVNQPVEAASSTQAIARFRDNGITKFRVNEGIETYQVEVAGDGRINSIWTISDKKLKKEIAPFTDALTKIAQLQPRTYQFKYQKKELKYLSLPEENQFGLIAQEVKKVFPNLVRSSMEYGENEEKLGVLHTVNYTGLIPVLLAGIQEQQQLIDEQTTQINSLKSDIEDFPKIDELLAKITLLEERLAQVEKSIATPLPNSGAKLYQNQPNPFHHSTTIPYFIPKQIQKAQLRVSNIAGQIIESRPISERGHGAATIETRAFPSGSYFYTLLLNGKIMETKQMILTK